MANLSGADIRSLARMLADAFTADEIASLVYESTGDRLYDEFVPDNLPLRPMLEKLLDALQKKGVLRLFLAAAHRDTEKNRPDVATEIVRVCPEAAGETAKSDAAIEVQEAGKTQVDGPARAAAPGFERNVRPNLPQLDVHVWLSRLEIIERQVCRVEISGNAAGTGFLVGPDVVLTNWHVVEAAKNAGRMGDVICRFDYLKLVNGTRQPGIAVALAQEGCVSYRTYSAAEKTKTPDVPEPSSNELDYALLRLERAVGSGDNVGPRGWIKLPVAEMPMKKGDPLIIVQHPDGAPMKLALDTEAIIAVNESRTRVRYATNTEAGSSGSPCFTLDWELIALHHFGDPTWVQPLYNQGVPAQLVRMKIVEDGLAALIGE
ncbi:trypsin-like serine peptidase [Bradyrhizobium sp. CCBAU 45394]|uniref:trypsin-like serine peptidase n=1 Tax=Bradyrhizobium sp. CCBAU 45394 TaxID=1325087 RepID=UPI0023049889|nr:serine protease [Bradyrhizobium sp. CCBAU 45394]